MNIRQGYTIFYIFLSVVEILSEYFEWTLLVYLTKPLLVLSLIAFILFAQVAEKPAQKKLFVTALIFAALGDVFLMIRGRDLFIPGLASFLIMQWLYIVVFRKQIDTSFLSKKSLLLLIPFLAYSGFLFWVISINLPDAPITFAVAIYAISIALMSWIASLRGSDVSMTSFIFVLTGALLFMISDSLIAVGRFLSPIPLQSIWVMGTYSAAQFMITMGVTKK